MNSCWLVCSLLSGVSDTSEASKSVALGSCAFVGSMALARVSDPMSHPG